MNGDIYIDGVIDRDNEQYVRNQLRANKDAASLTVHIASPGGDVYAGYNIYQALLATHKPINVIIEGEAQSIASFIALAGNTITALDPSVIMVHLPYSGVMGTADDHEAEVKVLRNIENTIAEAYSKKMSITMQAAMDLMKADTSMTAAQALQSRLIDNVAEPMRAVALGKPLNKTPMTKKEQILAKLESLDMSFAEIFNKKKKDKVEEPKEEPKVPAGKTLEEKIAELETGFAALKAENEALKASKTVIEGEKAAAIEEKEATVVMLGTIKTEFDSLKLAMKETVGNDAAPGKGNVNEPTAAPKVVENKQDEMMSEFLDLPQMQWMKQFVKQN